MTDSEQIKSLVLFLGSGFVAREIVRHYSAATSEDPLIKILWSAVWSTPISLGYEWVCQIPLFASHLVRRGLFEASQLVFAGGVGVALTIILRISNTELWDKWVGWRVDVLLRVPKPALDREIARSGPSRWYFQLANGKLLTANILSVDPEGNKTSHFKLAYVSEWSETKGAWINYEGEHFILRSEVIGVSKVCPPV